jgi:hypothetical protein
LLQPGENIDIWVVEKALGSGGMGSVYRCHNRTASRILAAVKTLDSSLRKVTGAEERFIREAEILFRIDHPHIVKVRNIRTDCDPPYLEMEFVEGESLENKLERGAIDLHDAIVWSEQLMDAAMYLHDQGIRHRDIKPANVLVTKDGRVKLVDFGLAMEADVTRITQAGMSFGTVSYAPPEWVYPEQIDPVRWDIYAIGVVMWEMLTGGVAFPVSGQGTARQQAMQVMLQKQKHDPMDPGPAFSEGLRALVRKMTASDAANRPGSARTCLEELKRVERNYERPVGQTLVAPEGTGASLFEADAPKPRRPSVMAVSQPVGPAVEPKPAARAETGTTWVEGNTPHPAPVAGKHIATPQPGLETVESPTGSYPIKKKTSPEPVGPADTLALPRPVTASESPSRLPLFLGIGTAGAALMIVAVVVVIVAVVFLQGGADRDLDVVVSGLPSGVPVTMQVADVLPSKQDAWVYTYRDIPLGKAKIVAVVGAGCAPTCASGGTCEAWCGVQTVEKDILDGDDMQTLMVSLEPPLARAVTLDVTGHPEMKPTIEVGGRVVNELLPGRYDATLIVGDVRWPAALTVPWAAGSPLTVPAPPVVPAKVEAKVETKAETKIAKIEAKTEVKAEAKVPVAVSAGKLVTNAELAKWLAAKAEYQREEAIAAGIAGGSYLQGWTGAEPPAGQEAATAVNVSWYIAQAYCVSKGADLPSKDTEPKTWSESASAPGMEWRVDGSKAVMHGSDGMDIPAKRSDANAITGFRCAK